MYENSDNAKPLPTFVVVGLFLVLVIFVSL